MLDSILLAATWRTCPRQRPIEEMYAFMLSASPA